jgi:hypothetical protein
MGVKPPHDEQFVVPLITNGAYGGQLVTLLAVIN